MRIKERITITKIDEETKCEQFKGHVKEITGLYA